LPRHETPSRIIRNILWPIDGWRRRSVSLAGPPKPPMHCGQRWTCRCDRLRLTCAPARPLSARRTMNTCSLACARRDGKG